MLAPSSLIFEEKELLVWTFAQLEQQSHKHLRQKAWQMRDQVGADRLPAVPHDSEAIIMWLLETQARASGRTSTREMLAVAAGTPNRACPARQAAISRIVGPELSIYDFGFKDPANNDGIFGMAPSRSPPKNPMDDVKPPVVGDMAMVNAFNEATAAREASKQKARGSGIF